MADEISFDLASLGPSTVFDRTNQLGPYRRWWRTDSYVWSSGLVQQALAGPPGTPAKQVRKHSGKGRRVVRFFAVRDGAEPVLPAPDLDTAFQWLLRAKVVTDTPRPLADGITLRYATRGVYVYALSSPVTTAQGFDRGACPVATVPRSANFQPSQVFSNQT